MAIAKKGIINIVKKSAVYVVPVVLVSIGWYFTRRAR